MFCNQCGAQLKEGAKFCNQCGTPVRKFIDSDALKNIETEDNNKNELPEQPVNNNERSTIKVAEEKQHLHDEICMRRDEVPKSHDDKKSKKIITWTLIIVVVVALAIIVFLILKKLTDNTVIEDTADTEIIQEKVIESSDNSTPEEEVTNIDTEIDQFVDSWWCGARAFYCVTKNTDGTVSVEYSSSGGSKNGTRGYGTGYIENGELVVNMEYEDYMYDDYGNEAIYSYGSCKDHVRLCSDIEDDEYITTGENVVYCVREGSESCPEDMMVSSLSDCEPREDFIIWVSGHHYTDDYENIFWYSSQIYLNDVEVSLLDKDSLKIARNEIYARHNRMFKDSELQEYFNKCSWYEGTIQPELFDDSCLSEIEKANIQLIKTYEDK